MKSWTILILYFVICFESYAQKSNSGIIQGRVFNGKNNEPVPFANIVIYQGSIGTASDVNGNFKFTGVLPGFLKLQVSAIGFETYITPDIMATNAKMVNIDIPMVETSISIDEVVVRPSVFRKNEESPLSLRRIGIQDIERNPGANRDISKVIQSFPGVAFTPAQRNDVIVRGGGPGENTFFLDEVEIPNINHFATQGASGGSIGIVNVDFVREVNFYSGAFPANRGNALSSVLEFKQKDGNTEKMETQGTIGASELALTFDGPMGDKSSFIFSARRSYLQLLFEALQLPFLPTYNDIQFKTKTKINAKNELNIIGLAALDQFRLNLSANETEGQKYILSYLPVNEQWGYTIGAVWKHYREKSYNTWVISRSFLNNTSYKYQDNIEVDSLLTFNYKSNEAENKVRYENTVRTDLGYKINYGAGFEYSAYTNTTMRKEFFNSNLLTLNYNTSIDLWKWSVFGQISKGFFHNSLSLSIGVRADANNYSDLMSNLAGQVSPRISISYKLNPVLSINFNTGRYFQEPAYTTLGFKDNSGELVNKKNEVKFISVDHLVTGVEFLPNQFSVVSVEGFFKYYRNYPFSVGDSISLANKGADYGAIGDEEVVSIAEGRSYGLEILARSRGLWGFNVVLSYTLVRSEFKKYGLNVLLSDNFIPSSWDNKHLLNLTATRELKRNWQIGIKWRYAGGAPFTPSDRDRTSQISAWNARGREYPDYSQFNTLRLGPFHQLDIRADKQFFYDKWSLMLYLDIQNLYNFKSYGPDKFIPQTDDNGNFIVDPEAPGRYLMKTIPSEGDGTILPSIGIIVQF